MENRKSISAVDGSLFLNRFRRPLYKSYCFSNLLGTIFKSFGYNNHFSSLPTDVLPNPTHCYDKIVLLMLDGFGWRFFQQYSNSVSELQELAIQGNVSKLTSCFPSTTVNLITFLHSGVAALESGVFEWFYYDHDVDAVIKPIYFSYAKQNFGDGLSKLFKPNQILPIGRVYPTLEKLGISSYLITPHSYSNGTYNRHLAQGATIIPYTSLEKTLEESANLLARPERSLTSIFFDDIDEASHDFGPTSTQVAEKVKYIFQILVQHFLRNLRRKKKILLLITADHGSIETDSNNTCYVDRSFPQIIPLIKQNRRNEIIVPGGSSRDFFLYIKPDNIEEAYNLLSEGLADKAKVFRVNDLLKEEIFGMEQPSIAFKQNVGDLVILPYRNHMVFWSDNDTFKQEFKGHHGGLTPEEMDIPLIAVEF